MSVFSQYGDYRTVRLIQINMTILRIWVDRKRGRVMIMKDKYKTKVVFRQYQQDSECIALFPQHPADNYGWFCSSYMHVGQHGGADTQIVVRQTRPATKREYTPLVKELRQRGYRLDIRRLCTSTDRRIRMAEARNK